MSGLGRVACVVFSLALVACDDADDERDGGAADAGTDGAAEAPLDSAVDAVVEPQDAGPVPDGATRFVLRIENVAGPTFPTPLGSGVAVVHPAGDPLFTQGAPDRGRGLEALAEDGDPRALAAALGGRAFAGIAPGDAREIAIDADPARPRVSFATMVAESNDVFLAPAGEGIPLFDPAGRPLPARDVTELVHVWNAGTEIDQAPGLGPLQAPRQTAPNSGPAEGSIRPFADGTRALPLARDLARVQVHVDGRRITLTLENVAQERGLFVTALSSVFWAVHSDSVRLFEEGEAAPANGLEALVEEADARPLTTWAAATAGVLETGIADHPLGTDRRGMLQPGDRVEITVEPDALHPRLSLAATIISSNDAFLSFPGAGVRLLDDAGAPRQRAEIEREILRALSVWDAGTEANEVPGAGPHAGPRPGDPDAGGPDPDPRVRRYDDVTNDLAPEGLGRIVDLQIRRVSGSTFEVTIVNRSDDTPYSMLLTPFVYGVHDDETQLFDPSGAPSPGLISLAEDCFTNILHEELQSSAGFERSAVVAIPVGDADPGPLRHGERYVFTITADPGHRRFNLAAMPYPSNDIFVALDPEGLELLDAAGAPRSDAAIAADLRRMFRAWDVGSEANQAGGAGRDAVPLQPGIDLGASEGDGTVRRQADPIWSYPPASELVRVTIAPE